MAFNILLLVIVTVAAFLGFRKGMLSQIGALVGVVVGVVACRTLYGRVVDILYPDAAQMSVTSVVVTYVAIFAVAYLIVKLIAMLASKVVHGIHLGLLDRAGGAIFKVLEWAFVCSLLVNVWVSLVPSQVPESVWGERIIAFAPAVLGSETATELLNAVHPKQEAPHVR